MQRSWWWIPFWFPVNPRCIPRQAGEGAAVQENVIDVCTVGWSCSGVFVGFRVFFWLLCYFLRDIPRHPPPRLCPSQWMHRGPAEAFSAGFQTPKCGYFLRFGENHPGLPLNWQNPRTNLGLWGCAILASDIYWIKKKFHFMRNWIGFWHCYKLLGFCWCLPHIAILDYGFMRFVSQDEQLARMTSGIPNEPIHVRL